ncbi:MAG TPA: diguanylate cyclase [Pseudorhodoferax sp.]|nr:diguanylate cyclase [Pseudorhodoferax sp.]
MNADVRSPAPLPAMRSWTARAVGPLLVIALVLLLAVLAIVGERTRSREHAQESAQQLARLAETRLSDALDRIGLDLQLAALRYGEGLAPGRPTQVAEPRLAVTPLAPLARLDLDGPQLADATGAVRIAHGLVQTGTEQVGREPFFRNAVAEPRAGLVVAAPLAATGQGARALVFARAVRDPQGALLGVAFAGMSGAQFDQLFDGLGPGPGNGAASGRDASVSLWSQDLQRLLGHAAAAREGSAAPAALRQALARAPLEGSYEAAGPRDGQLQRYSYRQLRGQPLYLAVAAPRSQAQGWADALPIATLAGLAIAATLWTWWMQDRWARGRMQVLRSRFEAVFRSASDSIVGQTLEGRITAWNRGAQQMFGYTAAEMLGQPAQRLAPPDRQDEDAALIARVQLGEAVPDCETQRLHKDGSVIDVCMAVSPLLDAQGRIAGIALVAREIGQRKAMEAQAHAMAFNDPLTRLPNQRLLMDRLRQAQLSSSRQRGYFAVLFIDLDGFRRVNEIFGHAAGDLLLIEIGQRLQGAVRQHDTVARLAGDAFVVLLEDLGADEKTAADHVNTVADKILDAIERTVHLGGTQHRCSASIGIRLLVGNQSSPEKVLMDADAAMYRVKRQRRALKSFAFE